MDSTVPPTADSHPPGSPSGAGSFAGQPWWPGAWCVDLGAWKQPGLAPGAALQSLAPGDLDLDLRRLAEAGGAALALATLLERAPHGFAIAVGPSVVAGEATAARASILAHSPLSGRLSQGQVGSDLGRRLARHTQALVLAGVAPWRDAVLWIDADSRMHLLQVDGIEQRSSRERAEVLVANLGSAAVLRPGPAAHAGVRFANLAAGLEPPSFVGRGGLGRALALRGLAAVVVQGEPIADAEDSGEDSGGGWGASLLRSPRLIARSKGERLQEAEADGASLAAPATRHGCRGCPTPCGFAFVTPEKKKGGARFSALQPLLALFPSDPGENATRLLEACNELGIDSREAAQGLQLVLRVEGATAPDRVEALVARLRDLALQRGETHGFELGAQAMSERLGIELPTGAAQGESTRKALHFADALAQAIGVRGPEPLRSYGFLLGDRADPVRMRSIVSPMHLPADSEATDASIGKGRLLWWHENLVAGVDVLGLCAFSVAGVLADGVLTFDEVARAVLPPGLRWPGAQHPAESLLALGAHAIGAYQALDVPAPSSATHPHSETSGWQQARDEYFRLRPPLDRAEPGQPRNWPQGWGTAALGRPPAFVCQPEAELARGTPPAPGDAHGNPDNSSVTITVTCGRTLAVKIPSPLKFVFPAPPTGLALLEALAEQYPHAREWLLRAGRPIPALVVNGAAQSPELGLPDGAVVELVLAISGG